MPPEIPPCGWTKAELSTTNLEASRRQESLPHSRESRAEHGEAAL